MKIAVFRALQLGDLLCAIPAIRNIRYNFPKAHIAFVGLPTMKSLIARFDYVDEYIDFPGYPGLPEQEENLDQLDAFVEEMERKKFDIIFQMQGNGTIVNDLLRRWGADKIVGFCVSLEEQDSDFMMYPDGVHETEKHLLLLRHIGLNIKDTHMEFPVFERDRANFRLLEDMCDEHKFVVIHPGSRDERRRWSTFNFAKVANRISGQGYKIVLTGTLAEQDLINNLADLLIDIPINLCGKTDLGTVGVLLETASLLVCNCTGISHIAAGIGTKSIVFSMDGEPERWGPKNKKLHHTFDATGEIAMHDIFSVVDILLADDGIGKYG
ncbi:glycosyltransferase family 9 protein [Sphingobacterium pedocola]|uniref:LPS biosynthesis glycosyltransferase n=1 Tax=Sphingobacterium pedocola TaxID=2082722 RepID=A0ABR9TCG3_9SPHI|nr:glycosyltransferase family 9 protein [Sphingobacterium pedocola]MBE8723046.1 LPS biosynthesis glycosyltransferase [Sphingobacterium pedocola]